LSTSRIGDESDSNVLHPAETIEQAFSRRMMYSLARDAFSASDLDAWRAAALTVRDRLVERWFVTQRSYYAADSKRVYYLSLEFLLGRLFRNSLLNLGLERDYRAVMEKLGYDFDEMVDEESDAGLGNGGLGRLAACFLDSAATLSVPFYGYGIRYEYGIFRQEIVEGEQTEVPDAWLQYGNPWEIARADIMFPVRFYGRVESYKDGEGRERQRWIETRDVQAMAHDILVPGFGNDTVNFLRLWAAKSARDFDLAKFNAGAYVAAVEDKYLSENISKVLYPPDEQYEGRELRLKQQYFFTSATIQDVLRRFLKRAGRRRQDLSRHPVHWRELPDKVAIQLNDTHPAIAIPELMRVLVDDHAVDWDEAWWICERVFAYTNHTVLPEALESWPSSLLGTLLPRHMQIIEEIDRRFRHDVTEAWPGDEVRLRKMAIVNDFTQNVRMANLAIVGSHAVNGVAALHTEILKATTFPEFHEFFPRRFQNKTNGVTPRRWLMAANPELTALITEAIGDGWMKELTELRGLEPLADDSSFRQKWTAARAMRKAELARTLRSSMMVEADIETLFDVQIKRIHEYKRQLLNVLHVLALYHRIHDGEEVVPRTILFAGKAAPGYRLAKAIIALIHAVAAHVSADPRTRDRLSVHFIPNYSVSWAELLFPATDLSEQISTAGTEASGTGCMKAVMNGGIIIGTLDGANVEIRDQVGEENLFIFGETAEGIERVRREGYSPGAWIERSPLLGRVISTIASLDNGRFGEISTMLGTSDRYFHCLDFDAFVAAQERAAQTWLRGDDWTRMSILNTARSGFFSSDRTIAEYAEEIWGVAGNVEL
jgi:starch phosphorylase